ncbi:MAG: hypothetical protein EP329_23375 [Deltaproteobacteria bacterium]|nr:MAG: hypothetical protein EP329_23375 [Deltaproteobacteria bacterium]
MTNSSVLARRPRGKAPIALIAILAVVVIAVVLFLVLRGGGGGGAAAQLASAHIPAEADYVGGVDVQGVLKSDLFKSALADAGLSLDAVDKQLAEQGIKLTDLKTLAFGAIQGEGGVPSGVIAIGNGAFDATKVKGAITSAKMAELAAMGEMPVRFEEIEVIDPQTVVLGSGDLVKKSMGIASGASKSVDSREELKALRASVDQGATFWFAGPVPKGMERMGGLGMLGGGDLGEPTHIAVSANIGSKIDVRLAIRFASGDAGAAASQLDSMLGLAAGMAEGPEADLLSSLDISGSGQVMTVSVTLTKDFIEKAAKGGGGMLPF